MKKITLLFLSVFITYGLSAQQTISFESSEGYTLGDINTQNGWAATGDGMGGFVTNQFVTDEQASDGTNSFKIDVDPAFGGQQNPVIGGFYDYSSAIPHANATISADLFIDPFNANSSDYIFGLVNITDGVFVTYVRFTFEGNIVVLAADALGTVVLDDTNQDWIGSTWFNLRVELTNNALEVFIDDNSIYTGNVASPNLDIENFRFIHDNFGGFAYIDNFRTNDEPLSTEDFDSLNFNYFVDAQNILNLNANEALSQVKLYNMLGQEVMSKNLSNQNEAVDINALNTGVYLAKVQINNAVETFKFVKK
jgi:hypothetical protein